MREKERKRGEDGKIKKCLLPIISHICREMMVGREWRRKTLSYSPINVEHSERENMERKRKEISLNAFLRQTSHDENLFAICGGKICLHFKHFFCKHYSDLISSLKINGLLENSLSLPPVRSHFFLPSVQPNSKSFI